MISAAVMHSLCLHTLNKCVCYRYKESHVVTARAAVTVIHPELGCLISSTELQNYSIILLYAEEGSSPGQNILPLVTERWTDHNKGRADCRMGCSWWSTHLSHLFSDAHSETEELHT